MKRKYNGFTIVEMLAVIVILGISIIIIMPNIIGISDREKQTKYNQTLDNIYMATEAYINNIYTNPTYPLSIALSELVEEDYIKAPIKNPLTGGDLDYSMHVLVTKNTDNTLTYSYPFQRENEPDLFSGLVPVYYDYTNMVWRKAPSDNEDSKWYDYLNQKWANAVTIISASRTKVQALAIDAIIDTADINTFWVWIPRYEYRIQGAYGLGGVSTASPGEIEVKFISSNKTTSSTGYIIHPAFTFGTTNENGIWLGKFETTGLITAPTILPDLASLRTQTTKAMYDSVKTYIQSNATYGFASDSDAHISLQTEWGAVAYLSQSLFGKYGNPNYSGTNKEVYKNNSSSFFTGRSMGAPGGSGLLSPTYEYIAAGYYTYDGKCASIYTGLQTPCASGSVGQILSNKNYGYGASSTGNVYGIYDMSGGSEERVMAMYKSSPLVAPTGIMDLSGFSTTTTNSLYENLPISKYYNQYITTSSTTACGGPCYGNILPELSNWYNDSSTESSLIEPWKTMGGNQGITTASGVFATGDSQGSISSESFRISLMKP